jgi:hypothetical protein
MFSQQNCLWMVLAGWLDFYVRWVSYYCECLLVHHSGELFKGDSCSLDGWVNLNPNVECLVSTSISTGKCLRGIGAISCTPCNPIRRRGGDGYRVFFYSLQGEYFKGGLCNAVQWHAIWCALMQSHANCVQPRSPKEHSSPIRICLFLTGFRCNQPSWSQAGEIRYQDCTGCMNLSPMTLKSYKDYPMDEDYWMDSFIRPNSWCKIHTLHLIDFIVALWASFGL